MQRVWHSLETSLRPAGEWGTSIDQSQPQGEMRRNPTCTQDWKIVEGRPMMAGSLLATIMMTQGDGAKLFKACSTRTHMGGAPAFLNLIMFWRCQWTNKSFPVLFRSKSTFQWNQLSRPHGPQKKHCLAVPSVCSCFSEDLYLESNEEVSSVKRISVCFFWSNFVRVSRQWLSESLWHVTCGCKSQKSLKPAQFTGFSLWNLQAGWKNYAVS